MQVTPSDRLEHSRAHRSIGSIRACSVWRAATIPIGQIERLEAVEALLREAQDYDADGILGLDFEVEGVNPNEGIPLRRIAARGFAIRFAEPT